MNIYTAMIHLLLLLCMYYSIDHQAVSPICLFAVGISFPHPVRDHTTVRVRIPEPDSFARLRDTL